MTGARFVHDMIIIFFSAKTNKKKSSWLIFFQHGDPGHGDPGYGVPSHVYNVKCFILWNISIQYEVMMF